MGGCVSWCLVGGVVGFAGGGCWFGLGDLVDCDLVISWMVWT